MPYGYKDLNARTGLALYSPYYKHYLSEDGRVEIIFAIQCEGKVCGWINADRVNDLGHMEPFTITQEEAEEWLDIHGILPGQRPLFR